MTYYNRINYTLGDIPLECKVFKDRRISHYHSTLVHQITDTEDADGKEFAYVVGWCKAHLDQSC